MPTDFSTLFDTLLLLAGLVLVVTGVVMFIRSKTSTQASSVEAFGIKLNVTHPSLILVLAGVGLMLAPRLLPGLPGKSEDKPEPAIVAEAPQPQAAAPTLSASPGMAVAPTPTPPPAPSIPTAPPPVAAAKATLKPAAAPPAAARSTPAAKPRITAPEATPKKPAPQLADARPAAAPAAPVQPEAAAPPPVAPKPARPTLAYAALGLPSTHSFWSGETRASYTRRMHSALQQSGRDVLHMEARGLELNQAEFDAWWNESRQFPRSRELCTGSHAPLALLSARADTPTSISQAESAYWPEFKLRLFVCANQRIYSQQRILSPQNGDAWPFSVELNAEIERFLRIYRSDLTD
jgi:hypothetical protein